MEHYGWTNKSTWKARLWLLQDGEVIAQLNKCKNPEEVRTLFFRIYDNKKWSKDVDWVQIYEDHFDIKEGGAK